MPPSEIGNTHAAPIRPANPLDAPALAQIRLLLHREVATPTDEMAGDFLDRCGQTYARLIADGSYRAWIAAGTDGAIVGTASVFVREMLPRLDTRETREARIQSVYVVPVYRSAGLGRRLMHEALAWIREAGISRVVLHPSRRARSL
ncbi:MAG: GNAT family N-acetyltransferase, partial [Vulcanimicrobiaceae bacterium]